MTKYYPMGKHPDLLAIPDKMPDNKYANKKAPHYGFKVSGIEPYAGPWNEDTAKHLLRRTLFGFRKEQVEEIVQMGRENAVNTLLTSHAPYQLPINDYYNEVTDPTCAPEQSWVNTGLNTDPFINGYRNRSYQAWWMGEMMEQPLSIQEKLTLFWHNHFATQISTINFANLSYNNGQLLRTNALGNLKTLTRLVTLDPAMLIYLNGFRNQKNKPDENYARELQELFTLGKGDASQYTEEDVRQAARILTGWTLNEEGETVYFQQLHDTGDKTFSSFYGNQTIRGNADAGVELDELLDMIFDQEEVSKHICRKLYRYFVYYVIDEEIEEKVIEPLAATLRLYEYNITPVLQQLFNSAHFYDPYTLGAIIKNPLDFMVSFYKDTNLDMQKATLTERSHAWYFSSVLSAVLQMQVGEPPNVAGWRAYYQNPQYHETWINSVTLTKRNQYTFVMMLAPNGVTNPGVSIYKDVLELTEEIANSNDPNLLIEYWAELAFAKGLSDEEKARLKEILLYGQVEDYYWTVAWEEYIADKTNPTKRNTVYNILIGFYRRLFNLPEYQLS